MYPYDFGGRNLYFKLRLWAWSPEAISTLVRLNIQLGFCESAAQVPV